MVATFNESSFKFEDGERAPEHEEGWSGRVERDPDLWHLDGYDTFEGETYSLASNIDTFDEAELLYRARMRSLERTQPTASSGGQTGIQDRVYVIRPGAA